MQTGANLTESQRRMADLWDEHTQSGFQALSVEGTLGTMTEDPYVNHVPVMTGGAGLDEVRGFYAQCFIPKQAPDTELTFVSRTVGENQLVDELIFKFTHTVEMDWMLPGIPPTGKRVEFPVVVVVGFRDEMIASERIYWDQASVLVQVGLIDPESLPVTGIEASRRVLDPTLRSNESIERNGSRG
ncbi:MAG: ester cyclase [Rubrobacter sp.]